MVVERDGRRILGRCFIRSFPQGMQAGLYGADSGHQTENAKDNRYPHAEPEFILQPGTDQQEETEREHDGKSKLRYP